MPYLRISLIHALSQDSCLYNSKVSALSLSRHGAQDASRIKTPHNMPMAVQMKRLPSMTPPCRIKSLHIINPIHMNLPLPKISGLSLSHLGQRTTIMRHSLSQNSKTSLNTLTHPANNRHILPRMSHSASGF